MQPGKKKSIAGLWRQITQPRLTDLQAFLQDMLCPPPARKMNFSDVEKLMHDRRGVEERLRRLARFRETRLKLEELRLALDNARRESPVSALPLRNVAPRSRMISRVRPNDFYRGHHLYTNNAPDSGFFVVPGLSRELAEEADHGRVRSGPVEFRVCRKRSAVQGPILSLACLSSISEVGAKGLKASAGPVHSTCPADEGGGWRKASDLRA
jgi:hypothetical protein